MQPRSLGILVVALSVVVALLLCSSIAFAFYAIPRINATAEEAEDAADQATAAVTRIEEVDRNQQLGREKNLRVICGAINSNARGVNAAFRFIQGIIVMGARQGKAFDDLYRAYGFPPFKERLKEAKKVAADLRKLDVPPLDCKRLVARAQRKDP